MILETEANNRMVHLEKIVEIEAWATRKICDPIESIEVDFRQYSHLKNVQLADECLRGKATVDVLIDIDYYNKLLKQEREFNLTITCLHKTHCSDGS